MAKLKDELLDKIAAKIIEGDESDDLAKFMLSGREHIEAVQRYFYNLEADKKWKLILISDFWGLSTKEWRNCERRHTGLSLFKLIAPSILPYVGNLYISSTKLEDYSFLKDIKNLEEFYLSCKNDKLTNILSGLSSLESVNFLRLEIKGLNLQLLTSFSFSFDRLEAWNFIFETDPKCDKIFQATRVSLHGDEEAMNDFVFNRQNYQDYFAIFPYANFFGFHFFVKVVDDVSDLMKVANASYSGEFEDLDETIEGKHRQIDIKYQFYDYSGYPNSEVLEMIENYEEDEEWGTYGCPYEDAMRFFPVEVSCKFPLAIAEVGNRLAEQSLWRIPADSNGSPEDYYQLAIANEFDQYAEFEVLKSILVEDLLEAYCEITGMYPDCLCFEVDERPIPNNGTVGESFKDGDIINIMFG